MNPPPGPGTPSVDHPQKSAPWNSPDYLPRGRRRVSTPTRPARHSSGRGTTAPRTTRVPREVRPVDRVQSGQRGTERRPVSSATYASRQPSMHSSRPASELIQVAISSTVASVISSFQGVFDPSSSGKGSKPVLVSTSVGNQRRRTLISFRLSLRKSSFSKRLAEIVTSLMEQTSEQIRRCLLPIAVRFLTATALNL